MVNYLLKMLGTDQAIAEYHVLISRYKQPSGMIPQQYAHDIFASSCKAADVYDESTTDNVYIKGADSSTQYSFRNNQTTHLQGV